MTKQHLPLPAEVDSLEPYLDCWKRERERLIAIIDSTPVNSFNSAFPDNSWSVAQLSDHLHKTQLEFGRVIKPVLRGKFGEELSSAPPVEYAKILEYLNGPRGLKNPESVTPGEQLAPDEIKAKLATAMEKLVKVAQEYQVTEFRQRGFEHPLYGLMNLVEWLWMLPLHERMHINALQAKLKNSS